MSISILQNPNDYDLKCKSLDLDGGLGLKGSLGINPVLASDGSTVSANAGIKFEGSGEPYITSSSGLIRIGSNSASAGMQVKLENSGAKASIEIFDAGEYQVRSNSDSNLGASVKTDGSAGLQFMTRNLGTSSETQVGRIDSSGNFTVQGSVHSHNTSYAYGSVDWSGGSSTLTVAVAGMTSSDHVFVTPYALPSGGSAYTHAVCGDGEFVIHLTGNDASNSSKFHYHAIKAAA